MSLLSLKFAHPNPVSGGSTMVRFLVLSSVVALFIPSASSGVHLGVPPLGVRSSNEFSVLRPGNSLRASLRADCVGKSISLAWEYETNGAFQDPAQLDGYAKQVLPVSFWPTYVEVVDSNVLLVAGKERNGDTRIERWTVVAPLVAQPVGGSGFTLAPQPLSDVEAIYDDSVVGKDMVRTIFRLRGKPGAALVQFHDSRDLYEINWQVAPYALTPVLAATSEPALLGDFNAYDAGDHAALGCVYIFADNVGFFSVPALVLMDPDRNGTLDSRQVMTWQDYRSAHLNEADTYVELNGVVQ